MFSWQPLIQDLKLKLKVQDKLLEIANTLINYTEKNDSEQPGVLDGKIGLAIFFFYYSYYSNERVYSLKASKILEDEISKLKIEHPQKSYSFCSGLSGICWAINHLSKQKFIITDVDNLIDEYLFKWMKENIDNGNYDFLHGAIGTGMHFIQSNKNLEYLTYLVDGLIRNSKKTSKGITWEAVLKYDSDLKGYYLGLSHGIISVIVFLSKLYKNHICLKEVEPLIKGAINFLLSNKNKKKEADFLFPYWVHENQTDFSSRLAWCHGDLGIGIGLWQTGENINDISLKEKAIRILKPLLRKRGPRKEFVIDAILCHGAIGIAHIFNRVYNYTKDHEFKDAAIFWYEEALKMAKFEDGLAGYKTWDSEIKGGWKNTPWLLEGITGIGLSLISATSFIEPAWDECLLLS